MRMNYPIRRCKQGHSKSKYIYLVLELCSSIEYETTNTSRCSRELLRLPRPIPSLTDGIRNEITIGVVPSILSHGYHWE